MHLCFNGDWKSLACRQPPQKGRMAKAAAARDENNINRRA